jgi:hypothetical protein
VEKFDVNADVLGTADEADLVAGEAARPALLRLRGVAIALGLGWSFLFILVGLAFRLQLYGDGSIFAYSVAVRAGWDFHFRDIADRLFVYAFAHLPAETYVGLTGDARGGIALYGLLFFAAPLIGLAATFAADRSPRRIIFACACLSTACLCPLVFGFPTEMWIAHSLFWPALALCHYVGRGVGGTAAVFVALLALALTHEGAAVCAVAIVATVALRGWRDPMFIRAAGALAAVIVVWAAVKLALPPDRYYASIIPAAALNFIDIGNLLASTFFMLMFGALAAYAVVFLVVRLIAPAQAHLWAFAIVALALIVYWLHFDHSLHTQNRYYVRTAIFFITPLAGALAALVALRAEKNLRVPIAFMAPHAEALADLLPALTRGVAARAAVGAILTLTLVHAVETAKFVNAWTGYKAAVRALAMGTASDPALGDPRFVSSERITPDLNRLRWQTTTPYLAVLLAPGFRPARLVIDPTTGYFWLSCRLATANAKADLAIPRASRELIRAYECEHR